MDDPLGHAMDMVVVKPDSVSSDPHRGLSINPLRAEDHDSINHAINLASVKTNCDTEPHQHPGISTLVHNECHDLSSVIQMATIDIADTSQGSHLISSSMDPEGVSQLGIDQYVVEVFGAANEIEVNTDDTEDVILPDVSSHTDLHCALANIKSEVPSMVGAETVVTTTTQPRRRKQRLETTPSVLSESPVTADDIDAAEASALWGAAIQAEGLYSCSSADINAQVVEVLTSANSRDFVALAPDSTCIDIPVNMQTISSTTGREASIREIAKRERDRLKKRSMRTDPEFRLLEKDKCRERMRLKRSELGYREKEREKDRIRRRQARQRNDILRQRERERDKHYKKVQRRMPLGVSSVAQVETDSYSLDLVEFNGVDL